MTHSPKSPEVVLAKVIDEWNTEAKRVVFNAQNAQGLEAIQRVQNKLIDLKKSRQNIIASCDKHALTISCLSDVVLQVNEWLSILNEWLEGQPDASSPSHSHNEQKTRLRRKAGLENVSNATHIDGAAIRTEDPCDRCEKKGLVCERRESRACNECGRTHVSCSAFSGKGSHRPPKRKLKEDVGEESSVAPKRLYRVPVVELPSRLRSSVRGAPLQTAHTSRVTPSSFKTKPNIVVAPPGKPPGRPIKDSVNIQIATPSPTPKLRTSTPPAPKSIISKPETSRTEEELCTKKMADKVADQIRLLRAKAVALLEDVSSIRDLAIQAVSNMASLPVMPTSLGTAAVLQMKAMKMTQDSEEILADMDTILNGEELWDGIADQIRLLHAKIALLLDDASSIKDLAIQAVSDMASLPTMLTFLGNSAILQMKAMKMFQNSEKALADTDAILKMVTERKGKGKRRI